MSASEAARRMTEKDSWTLHVLDEDVPWVEARPGIEQRILHARPSAGFIVTQSRYQPGASAGRHRHVGPVFAMTKKGAWSHDPYNFPYVAGTYVYEPIGVIHQFFNGPQVSEATFVLQGDVEFFEDDSDKVKARETAAGLLKRYLERCEAAGLPRPNVLD
jgi:quercetin dioxygenase-like cupin family protein